VSGVGFSKPTQRIDSQILVFLTIKNAVKHVKDTSGNIGGGSNYFGDWKYQYPTHRY